MFARKVVVCLKPNTLAMFTHLMERELLPWLRRQDGFVDLITLADPDGIEVQVISFWTQRANAEAQCNSYPPVVLRILESVLDGIARGKTFNVITSTVERLAPARLAASGNPANSAAAVSRADSGRGSCETNA